MIIVAMGMELGIYKSLKHLPWTGGPSAPAPSEEDPDRLKDAKAASGVEKEAKSLASAACSSTDQPPTETPLMKVEDESLAALRKRCKNTLFMAA